MTALWRNGDYTVPTQKRKQRKAHGEAVRIREVCAGTVWLGCERLGPPEGWTWRVRESSGDRWTIMTSGWTNSRVSALIICFRCLLSPERTNYTTIRAIYMDIFFCVQNE
jgi:hypothetical protein